MKVVLAGAFGNLDGLFKICRCPNYFGEILVCGSKRATLAVAAPPLFT